MTTETKLQGIARLSSGDPERTFINMMHLFNEESLKACFPYAGWEEGCWA